jgi:hypothetical protein
MSASGRLAESGGDVADHAVGLQEPGCDNPSTAGAEAQEASCAA